MDQHIQGQFTVSIFHNCIESDTCIEIKSHKYRIIKTFITI